MFSYNSFKSGYNINGDENMGLQEESKEIIPLAPENLLPLENLYCPCAPGKNCIFDDYEPVYNHQIDKDSNVPMAGGMCQKRPYLSNNHSEKRLVLFKKLSGYPGQGSTSNSADILYTGNAGEWNINLPQNVRCGMGKPSILQIRITLDDHMEVPLQNYYTNISFNERILYDGILRASHCKYMGTKFTNWRLLSFRIDDLRKNNIVRISNSSRTSPDDWIGIDWIQLIV